MNLGEIIQTWLDPVGIVIGIVMAVPVFWTWYDVVFGSRRRERRWFQEIRMQPGARPAILIVDLLPGKNIRATVERFLQQDPLLKDIPKERIVTVRRNSHLTPDDMPELQQELRAAAACLLSCGTDTLHFFHAGPAAIAAMVGAEMANASRVMVYQHEAGQYRNFGPLKGPFQ